MGPLAAATSKLKLKALALAASPPEAENCYILLQCVSASLRGLWFEAFMFQLLQPFYLQISGNSQNFSSSEVAAVAVVAVSGQGHTAHIHGHG